MNQLFTAPVCLFVYKKITSLQQTVKNLQQNELASITDLYIFSDAANSHDDFNQVDKVREFIKSITGFKSVTIKMAEKNKGLAASVISGVTEVINRHEKIIVLEDDLLLSSNFLVFMNGGLTAYQHQSKVFSIAGYSSPVLAEGDVYFTRRSSSWGWATWQDRWGKIDWSVQDYEAFMNDSQQQKKFNAMGSDLTHMLKKQMRGVINSWAIRWVYHQFKNNLYTVYPVKSKVKNIGFETDGSNTNKSNETRFVTHLDESNQHEFYFPPVPFEEEEIMRQFLQPYTVKTRVIYKIRSLLHL